MAAHADLRTGARGSLRTRIKAYVARFELDRRLAAGTIPAATPELARRAQVLSSWRGRHALADGIERTLAEAAAPPRPHGVDVAVQRDETIAARPELLRLAAALRAEPAPGVRGIAAASPLLSDGSSPLFCPSPPGTLREAALQAAFPAEAV